jgi:mannitol/fructose-specific phosphotransferase system IIA component
LIEEFDSEVCNRKFIKIMALLKKNNIKLGASVRDKADAIRQVGTLLVDTGQMKPEYITSMRSGKR